MRDDGRQGLSYDCLLATCFCLYVVRRRNSRQALDAERDERREEVDDLRQRLAALQAESAEQAASMDAQLQAAQGQVDSITQRAEELQASAASSLGFPLQLIIVIMCHLHIAAWASGLGYPQLSCLSIPGNKDAHEQGSLMPAAARLQADLKRRSA